MASIIRDIVLKVIADSGGVASGLKPGINSLDALGAKAEANAARIRKQLEGLEGFASKFIQGSPFSAFQNVLPVGRDIERLRSELAKADAKVREIGEKQNAARENAGAKIRERANEIARLATEEAKARARAGELSARAKEVDDAATRKRVLGIIEETNATNAAVAASSKLERILSSAGEGGPLSAKQNVANRIGNLLEENRKIKEQIDAEVGKGGFRDDVIARVKPLVDRRVANKGEISVLASAQAAVPDSASPREIEETIEKFRVVNSVLPRVEDALNEHEKRERELSRELARYTTVIESGRAGIDNARDRGFLQQSRGLKIDGELRDSAIRGDLGFSPTNRIKLAVERYIDGVSERIGQVKDFINERPLISGFARGFSSAIDATFSGITKGAFAAVKTSVGVVSGLVLAPFKFAADTFKNAVGFAVGSFLSEFTVGLASAARSALETAGKFQEDQVSLRTLTGSRETGDKLISDLQKLGVETPFKSSELIEQAKLLISYGVETEKLVKTISQLGDVSAGTGAELGRLSLAYGQVIAKGRLQGTEIRQFTEAGVGIRDFANAYSELQRRRVTVPEFLGLVEEGRVGSDVIVKAFERMTGAGGRFFNLMEERSKTVSGRFQALSESIEQLIQKGGVSFFENTSIGQFLDRAGKAIQEFTRDLPGIDKFFQNLDRTAGKFATQIFSGAKAAVGGPPTLDFDSFGKRLDQLANETIPSVLGAFQDVTVLVLRMAQGITFVAEAMFEAAKAIRRQFGEKDDSRFVSFKEKAGFDAGDPKSAGFLSQLAAAEKSFGINTDLGKRVQERIDAIAQKREKFGDSNPETDRLLVGFESAKLLKDLQAGNKEAFKNVRINGLGQLELSADQVRLGGPDLKPEKDGPVRAGELLNVDTGNKVKAQIQVLDDATSSLRSFSRVIGDAADSAATSKAVDRFKKGVAQGGLEADARGRQIAKKEVDPLAEQKRLAAEAEKKFQDMSDEFRKAAEIEAPGFTEAISDIRKKLADPLETGLVATDLGNQLKRLELGRQAGIQGFDTGLTQDQFEKQRFLTLNNAFSKIEKFANGPSPTAKSNTVESSDLLAKAIIDRQGRNSKGPATADDLEAKLKVLVDAENQTRDAVKDTTKAFNDLAKKQNPVLRVFGF